MFGLEETWLEWMISIQSLTNMEVGNKHLGLNEHSRGGR